MPMSPRGQRAWPLAVALALGGCSAGGPRNAVCSSDEQCETGQVCFLDGCADPGQNVVVEVTVPVQRAMAGATRVPEDLLVGTLSATLDLEVPGASALTGTVQRYSGPLSATPPPTKAPYLGGVTILATGESTLIPGVLRNYEQTFTDLDHSVGTFAMSLGAGKYTLTATSPDELSIPPDVRQSVSVEAGSQAEVAFVFPSPDGGLVISGRLLRQYVAGPPESEVAITEAEVRLQAFDPLTMRPLSQRVPVSSGFPGSVGDFTLSLDPTARALDAVLLVATPRDTGAAVPSKKFTLHPPYASPLRLELGDYGTLLTHLTGQLRGGKGPIGDARIYLEGPVTGGGTFRSSTVVSDARGAFAIDALPSAKDAPFTLVAVPPSAAAAGILSASVKVEKVGGVGKLVQPSPPCADKVADHFCAPDRVRVTGTVERPDGSPALGVKVVASPLKALTDHVLPLDMVEGLTDENARFELFLDPAEYLFNFVPGSDLPPRSKSVTVAFESIVSGDGVKTVDLKAFQLSQGRKVTGAVTVGGVASLAPTTIPNAQVRFFHVATGVNGKPSSVLLGQTVADPRGQYSILLP